LEGLCARACKGDASYEDVMDDGSKKKRKKKKKNEGWGRRREKRRTLTIGE